MISGIVAVYGILLLYVLVPSAQYYLRWLKKTTSQKTTKKEHWRHLWPSLFSAVLIVCQKLFTFFYIWTCEEFHSFEEEHLTWYIILVLLWIIVLIRLFFAVFRSEEDFPFSPWLLLFIDVFSAAFWMSRISDGFEPLRQYLPIGSRPATSAGNAKLICLILMRIFAAFSVMLSVGLAWYHFRREKNSRVPISLRLQAIAVGFFSVMIPWGISLYLGINNHPAEPDFGKPVIQIELRDLNDNTLTVYECDLDAHMRTEDPFESDPLEILTGRNVYEKGYFNWNTVSELDDPVFMDADGNDLPIDAVSKRLLRKLDQKPGYSIGVRFIRVGELAFLETEIQDGLWRPFRLYGYDGERFILLATYDTKELTKLAVLAPDAFAPPEQNAFAPVGFHGGKWYSSADHKYITNDREEDGTIIIEIRDAKTDEIVASFETVRSRDYHGYQWERDAIRLWIWSGDIGTVCYAPDDKGNWIQDEDAVLPGYMLSD